MTNRLKQGIDLIIFDLDGTLIPTMQGFARIAADVIHEHFQWARSRGHEAYLQTSGIPFFQQLECLFPQDPRNSTASEEFERKKRVVFFATRIPDGTRRTLYHLKRRGILLAVSSNNSEELVSLFIRKQAPGIFDAVCGFKEGFAKGHEHFCWLLQRFQSSTENALFVGDSPADLQRAQDFGIEFVGVAGTVATVAFQKLRSDVSVVPEISHLPALLADVPPNAGHS